MDLSPQERAAFVEQIRSEDAVLGAELEALLSAYERDTSPIDSSPFPFSLDAPRFEAGQFALDRFQVVRFLGRGGMGEVYEAMDHELGRVALKTIRSDLALVPQMLTRFRHEVGLARRISSAHVCRIHDLFFVPSRTATRLLDF